MLFHSLVYASSLCSANLTPSQKTRLTNNYIKCLRVRGVSAIIKPSMECPVCNNPLEHIMKNAFICPKGDGILVTSKQLLEKDSEIVKHTHDEATTTNRNHDISCPHCHAMMHRVNYSSTGIIIDSCMKCHYRWLDRGEFKKIKNYKPKLSLTDMAFLQELQQRINDLDSSTSVLYSGEWDTLVRNHIELKDDLPGYMNTPEEMRRNFGYTAGIGIYGLIVSMIHSKFMRVVGPILLIGLFVLAYFISKQMELIDWKALSGGN